MRSEEAKGLGDGQGVVFESPSLLNRNFLSHPGKFSGNICVFHYSPVLLSKSLAIIYKMTLKERGYGINISLIK
jgi:hypothetical protein